MSNHQKQLCQFYTKHHIAKLCFELLKQKIELKKYDFIIEPSAGKGSLFNLIEKEKRIGLDIDPKSKEIIKMDYFDFQPQKHKTYIVVGNPPFGKISNLAIQFFNKSCEFCNVFAFILPRTFKRKSIQNKLNLNFHLIYNHDLPIKPCCFEPKMEAKCCFQIWKREFIARKIIKMNTKHNDFTFLKLEQKDSNNQPTKPKKADFAMKAYGSNCGELFENQTKIIASKNYHWIKSNIEKG